jgi:predicted DsbA family dithiol-disulfide isomerase
VTESSPTIEVYADVACPFTHVGLRRLVARRAQLGRDDVRLLIRAWPLELVNGEPIAPALVAEEVDALRASVAADLFGGFTTGAFPASSLPALELAHAATRIDAETGERVGLALRTALFEEGRDIAHPAVLAALAAEHGVPVDPERDRAAVLAEWRAGRDRGVRGSPEFFVGGHAWFCPALDIERVDDHLRITPDPEAMEAFLADCFGPPRRDERGQT